jgi:TetR/AcrR family transcriptional repressor of nem operon
MGRNRSFDENTVIAVCAEAFVRTGYEGTSIDDLVMATGLHRGSLYKAFASKRGLFLAALKQLESSKVTVPSGLDLLLIALIELAPRDAEVNKICARLVAATGENPASTLGSRLLERASIGTIAKKGTPS